MKLKILGKDRYAQLPGNQLIMETCANSPPPTSSSSPTNSSSADNSSSPQNIPSSTINSPLNSPSLASKSSAVNSPPPLPTAHSSPATSPSSISIHTPTPYSRLLTAVLTTLYHHRRHRPVKMPKSVVVSEPATWKHRCEATTTGGSGVSSRRISSRSATPLGDPRGVPKSICFTSADIAPTAGRLEGFRTAQLNHHRLFIDKDKNPVPQEHQLVGPQLTHCTKPSVEIVSTHRLNQYSERVRSVVQLIQRLLMLLGESPSTMEDLPDDILEWIASDVAEESFHYGNSEDAEQNNVQANWNGNTINSSGLSALITEGLSPVEFSPVEFGSPVEFSSPVEFTSPVQFTSPESQFTSPAGNIPCPNWVENISRITSFHPVVSHLSTVFTTPDISNGPTIVSVPEVPPVSTVSVLPPTIPKKSTDAPVYVIFCESFDPRNSDSPHVSASEPSTSTTLIQPLLVSYHHANKDSHGNNHADSGNTSDGYDSVASSCDSVSVSYPSRKRKLPAVSSDDDRTGGFGLENSRTYDDSSAAASSPESSSPDSSYKQLREENNRACREYRARKKARAAETQTEYERVLERNSQLMAKKAAVEMSLNKLQTLVISQLLGPNAPRVTL